MIRVDAHGKKVKMSKKKKTDQTAQSQNQNVQVYRKYLSND